MTNTLHRFGPAESFRDDYVVFAMCSKGRNDQDSLPKLKRFLELALPLRPVNLGDAIHGGALRPSKNMNPSSHWHRDTAPDFQAVIDGLTGPTTVAAVFDNRVAAEDFVKAVKAADLGLSINISSTSRRPSMGPSSAASPPVFLVTASAIPSVSRARRRNCQAQK